MKQRSLPLKMLLATLAVAFWIAVWWILAWKIGKPLLLPAPNAVLIRFSELIRTAEFWEITLISIRRILLGIFFAVLIGIPLAVLTARSAACRILLQPLMTAIRATPVAAFIVLIWLWIGQEEVPTIITVLVALPVVHKNVEVGITSIDPALTEMTRAFRVPLLRRVLRLDLPSILPAFRGAIENAVGLGWKAGVAAEILVRPLLAIGRKISDANYNLESTDLFAWTLTVVLLSLVIEFVFSFLLSKKIRLKRRAKTETEEQA